MKFLLLFLALSAEISTEPALAQPALMQLPKNVIGEFADMLFSAGSYRPIELDDPALSPATREFGPTVIPMNQLPIASDLVGAEKTPWSSHWFPRAERDLFDNGRGTSVLEKFDKVRATLTGDPSRATEIERGRWSADAPKWEGLCDAWAIASIIFPEPVRNKTLRLDGGYYDYVDERVSFTVGDQKALLLKSVEAISPAALKVFGQKFLGDFEAWIYPDLFPQELHRFVEKQIFERRQAFVMDHDPGVEVWNEPVYRANYTIEAVPGRDDAVSVRLWLYSAAPLRAEEKDNVGTKEIVREYNYQLFGQPDGQGNLVVESGVWLKGDLVDSRRDHPDYVFVIPDPAAVERASHNKEIDPLVVDQIVID